MPSSVTIGQAALKEVGAWKRIFAVHDVRGWRGALRDFSPEALQVFRAKLPGSLSAMFDLVPGHYSVAGVTYPGIPTSAWLPAQSSAKN
jgi:hypothetical protein